jgi:hypothetical protein
MRNDDGRRDRPALPGCGLAAFAMLLGCIFCVGISGLSVGYFGLLSGADELSPTRLSYGGLIDGRLLRPMRTAGLLKADEVPDAFHAETLDGTRACAISKGMLLRVQDGVATQLPLSEIARIERQGETVVAVGTDGGLTVPCPFSQDEGGDRFARMIAPRSAAP